MSPILFTILFKMAVLATPAQAAPAPVDLAASYEAAIARSETLQLSESEVAQAEERVSQAYGSVLPSLGFFASYTRQDTPDTTSSRNITPGSQPLVKLTASQPVFRGFREYAGLRYAKRSREATEQEATRERDEVRAEVAESYFAVLALERDLADLRSQVEVLEDRMKSLRSRVAIGRSRSGDLLLVESARAQALAEIEDTRGQLKGQRERFHFLTGMPREQALRDIDGAPSALGPVAEYLGALDSRGDIRAQALRAEAADELVTVARGEHLPSVDLSGNYYLKRAGVADTVDWDVQVALSLPIYSGGVTQSRVREAALLRKSAEIQRTQARRVAEREIRMLHASAESSLAQTKTLAESRALAERNYRLLKKDYELSLVTNLDVLQALANLNDSRRALSRARYQGLLELERLRLSAGGAGSTAAAGGGS